ncbi:GyrI-like domain-containing protein [Leucobacter luti]|uniref:GyrI-like domain-containing protein n=1 Tax=Leucobacter luti TaxID=340320 RepID=UPI003CFF2DF1
MDAPFDTPVVQDREEQQLAVVRATVAAADMPALYDRAFPLLFGALGAAGVAPAAAPMGVVHGAPGETFDLSVAVPVGSCAGAEAGSDASFASGEVTAETLPAGRAATLLVRGGYDRLGAAYEHLFSWVSAQGLTPAGLSFEQYLTEPEPGGDPALNETLIGTYLEG